MPVLLEIFTDGAGFSFESDDDFFFVTDADFVWDSHDEVLRVSTENFAGRRFWSGDILSVEPLQYQCKEHGGGLVYPLGLSSVEIAMKAFVDMSTLAGNDEESWKSTSVYWHGRFYWADSPDDEPTCLLECELYIKGITVPKSYTFAIFSNFPKNNLLADATDYNGNDVVLPQAYGRVSYVRPIRLPDSGGNQTYSACGLVGTRHTDWHVYDDGVDVCSNGTDITDDTFQLTVAPVGEVTVSGYGNASLSPYFGRLACSLDLLMQGLADRAGVAFVDTSAFSGQVEINTFLDSQTEVSEFIDKICAVFNYIALYRSGYMQFHEHEAIDYIASDLVIQSDAISLEIERRGPLRRVLYKYLVREAVEESIGKYVKETEKQVYFDGFGQLSIGETVEIDALDDADPAAAEVSCYMWWLYNQTFAFTLVLPLKKYATNNGEQMIYPGTEITVYDYRYQGREYRCYCNVMSSSYDFINKTVILTGHADVTEVAT